MTVSYILKLPSIKLIYTLSKIFLYEKISENNIFFKYFENNLQGDTT